MRLPSCHYGNAKFATFASYGAGEMNMMEKLTPVNFLQKGSGEAVSVLLDLPRADPKLDADHLVTDPHRPTTCEIRVMSRAHHMGPMRNRG
jgi:hypothetical protein